MTVSKQQQSLFRSEELLDELEPDPRRTEPVLWVRRLVILSRPSADAIVRNIPFQTGLNIIRTERRQPYESEVVAHSVGKTLLMRLLRYTLGESAFATTSETERIRKRLPDAVIVAEWVIGGQTWTIVRRLNETESSGPYVVCGVEWKESLRADASRKPLSEFVTRVEDAMFGELTQLQHLKGGPPGWLDVLPWIARDSNCGFRKPNDWRDKDLHPAGLRDLSVNKLIMQWLMGLMSEDEAVARDRLGQSREARKELRKDVDRHEHRLRQAYDSLAERSAFDVPQFDDGEDELPLPDLADELNAYVTGKKREAEEALHLHSQTAKETITTLTLRERQEGDQKTAAAIEAGNARTTRDLLNRQLRDENKKARGPEQCPAKDECAWLIQIRDEEAAGTWESKVQMLEGIQEEIQQTNEQMKAAERKEQRLAKQMEATRAKLQSVQGQMDKDRSVLERTVGRWEALHTETSILSKTASEFADVVEHHAAAEDDIKGSEGCIEVEHATPCFRHSVRRLTHCYLHVLRRVFHSNADGEVKVDRNGLMPHPSVELMPDGTAMAVMSRVLAFELACVIASSCGLGHHPRLVMHDSPREGEMEPQLFQRLFDVLEWMQATFGNSGCAFQYIITTTEPPPQFAPDHPSVVQVLHGHSDDGRLLKVRY